MRKIALLLFFACLVGSAFASGGNMPIAAGMAILLALAIIALVYMASYIFDQPQLRAMAQDEVVHLLATAIVLVCILGVSQALDSTYIPGLTQAAGAPAGGATLQDRALSALGNVANNLEDRMTVLTDMNMGLAGNASQSIYCNFLNAGYTLVSCSPLNMMRGGLTQGMVVVGIGYADISAEQMLVKMGQLYALTLLLPIGLFLHAFKATRAGGAALISVAVALYIVYPLLVLFCENMLVAPFAAGGSANAYGYFSATTEQDMKCDPNVQSFTQINDVRSELVDSTLYNPLIFQSLVRAVFLTILKVMIMLGFIRAFAAMLGSEVDVSTLARIS